MRENRRIGIVKVLQQILLDRRNVVDRLGHEAGQFLEAREAVEFQRVEIGFAFRRMGNTRLDLRFGLDFDVAQLAAQTNDVFRQFQQRALQAAHFAFDPGPGDGQLARFIDQTVDQVGTNAQGRPLTRRLAFAVGLMRCCNLRHAP